MTDPREAATLLAIGADTNGYAESSGVPWDDDLGTWNLRAIGERDGQFQTYVRDALATIQTAVSPPTATVRILCAGDSITVGEGSSDGAGYRPWLSALLGQRRIAATVLMSAVSGKTLREQAPAVLAALPAARPDVVLVDFGTNDAAQPDLDQLATRYGAFVDAILASSPTVRVACARVALSRAAWLANAEGVVNAAVDQVVAARKASGRVVSVDMTAVPQRWTVEGVHPLNSGYRLMARLWLDAIAGWLPTT